MEEYLIQFEEILIKFIPRLVGAILVLLVGLWVIRFIMNTIRRTFDRKKIDPSLIPFLSTLISILLKITLFISVIAMVGVKATSFLAIIGSAGLAIGLALQGTLQNFAGGVVLLILRPFRVGDVVDVQGFLGIIYEIRMFHTIIHTFDKKVVYLPNGAVANSNMTNLSQQEDRRNEWTFGIAYGDNVKHAKEIIQQLIEDDERILTEPEPFIALHSLGNSSVNIVVRAWSKAENLWPVYFDMNEKVYNTFAEQGINIPFPQMDVHLKNKTIK